MEDFKSFTNFLNESANPSQNIQDYSWDELYAYTFKMHSHNIAIITDVNKDHILPLWRKYMADAEHYKEDFDVFLRGQGHVAVCATKSDIRPLDSIT